MNPSPEKSAPVVLHYRRAPRPRARARILRISMLIIAILALHVAVILILHPAFPRLHDSQGYLGGGAIGTPFSPITLTKTVDGKQVVDSQDEAHLHQYLPRGLIYLFLFLLTQWWFLSPRGTWRIALSTDGPIPKRSAIAAGFIGMLLCIGLLATFMELPDLWLKITTERGLMSPQHFTIVWIVMGVLWTFWSVVFYLYFQSLDRYTNLRRIFRWLLAGTILEMFVAAPAHVWIVSNRGGECYCQRGTWTGVAFGCTAVLWLFGPGAYLLFLREKIRRQELI
jgi:hypothetical protein